MCKYPVVREIFNELRRGQGECSGGGELGGSAVEKGVGELCCAGAGVTATCCHCFIEALAAVTVGWADNRGSRKDSWKQCKWGMTVRALARGYVSNLTEI